MIMKVKLETVLDQCSFYELIEIANDNNIPGFNSNECKEILVHAIISNLTPEDIFYSLDKETLKKILDSYRLPRSGTKETLVNRIIPIIEKTNNLKRSLNLCDFHDLTAVVYLKDIPCPSEIKEKLIHNIILSKLTPEDIFYYLDKETLKKIIDEYKLPISAHGSYDNIVGKILPFITEMEQQPEVETKETTSAPSEHDELIKMIVEIGEMWGKYSQSNYHHERFIYDAIWKKLETGVPSHVFEVQIRGNLSDALMRLKHAHDLWSSKLFLILTEKDREKAEWSFSGVLHEIKDVTELISTEELKKYYETKKQIRLLEEKLK